MPDPDRYLDSLRQAGLPEGLGLAAGARPRGGVQ